MTGIRLLAAMLVALIVCGTGIALASDEVDPAGSVGAHPATEASAGSDTSPGVELTAQRTATSETFRLPNGSFETRLYESPIHHRGADGNWRPIETDFVGTSGGDLVNGENRFDVSLPAKLGEDPMRLDVGEEWIAVELLGPPTEPVRADGNVAIYEAASLGTTFEITGLPNGLKEDIVIDDLSQLKEFSFELKISDGLSAVLDDGSVEFRDLDGKVVAVLPAPIISDSAGDVSGRYEDIHYGLEQQNEQQWKLTVEADPAWLNQPERVWPVRIDPTLTLPSPSLDCTYFGNKNVNLGGTCGSAGGQKLFGWYLPNPKKAEEGEWRRSALRFTLSAIPASSSIESATLGLHSPAAAQETSGVEVRRALKDWTNQVSWMKYNSSTSWTNQGGDFSETEGTSILTAQRGSAAGWWNFSAKPMTDLVQRWVSGAIANQGFLVKLIDDKNRVCGPSSCTQRKIEFDSSAASNQSLRPYLTVIHNPKAPSASKVTSPQEGTQTARRLKLQAKWSAAGVTGLTFQYRRGDDGPFVAVPTNLVRDAQGQQPSWPLALQGVKQTEPLYFDIANADPQLLADGGPVQIRALFEGPVNVAGVSAPVKATVNVAIGGTGDATAGVGPGSVNLLTGNFSVARTDVSIPGFNSALEFSRVSNSREPGESADTSVLGRGWKPTIPVEAAGGAAWRSVSVVPPDQVEQEFEMEGYALLRDLEGRGYAFEVSNGSYVTPPGASGWSLYRLSSTQLALTDPDGNRTTFENSAGGSEYLPVSVSQTGGANNRTRIVYDIVNGNRRMSMVIAPTPEGPSCTQENATTKVGCRSLTFSYKAATTWGAPSSFKDRLDSISFHAATGPSSMGHWEVAKYSYDSAGRLTAQWDPRISPALKETYAYVGATETQQGGQIQTITPPGQEPWTLEYGALAGEPASAGRLAAVKRPSLLSSPSVAQTTVRYGIPLSGSGAPYDMSPSAVSQWGQQYLTFDATAIFPPDQVLTSSPPSSYAGATVYYMDVEGQLVNTATPAGAGTSAPSITTSETDEHGNIIRELSAQNRLRALAAGSSSVARSHELETKRLYSTDGTEMQEEWGPMHQVRLESGSVKQARMHTTIQYDEGAPTPPAGTPMPHLPTRETVGASISSEGIDADQRVTETKYDWALRKPTETIVDPQGLNLVTRIAYDSITGLPIERSLPAKPSGGDARTTKMYYYTADANSPFAECKKQLHFAYKPCKILPAAQPGTEGQPEILVKTVASYSALGQPIETTESPGGSGQNTRKTIATYDTVGRLISKKVEGNGTAILPQLISYSSTTGLPTVQKFDCTAGCPGGDNQATETVYDTLGRATEYKDADGNTSSVTYDLLGRPVMTSDGKGIQTRTYDPTSGLPVKLEDSAAGTFTASYDADGNLTEQTLPNGLTASTTYDETGSPDALEYEKTVGCSVECTWLEFEVEESIHGQWLKQMSTLSTQEYSYDKAGRLALVKDWNAPVGGSCTTREYRFEGEAGKNSNRTKMVTRAPGISGVCDTVSSGTSQSYGYDAADRLVGAGIEYDNYGRIKTLPSAYSGGGTLTSSYYVNDLVRSQTQGGVTNTYELDAALRQRLRTQTGGSDAGTEIYHYVGNSDSPVWIDRGSSWSRSIVGIGSELTAIQDSLKGTTFQLGNLHGDVVATASLDPEATELLATSESDEFGNPKGETAGKYGWLGGKQRRTELPSGVIQMGVRSYVPAMGRFLSPDPVMGGSANAYEYAAGDPVNNFDLTGEKCAGDLKWVARCKLLKDKAAVRRANQRGRLTIKTTEGGLRALLRKPLLLASMIRKVHKWEVEDLRKLRRIAAAAPPGLNDESLCDSAERASKVIDTAGFTAAVTPGGQGLALAIGIPGIGLTIGTWIAC